MGANQLRGPSTHYDDPAPVGGSFIVTCAKVTENTAATRAVRASNRLFATNDPNEEERLRALRGTAKGVCDEIIAMISESLKAKTSADWIAYWRSNLEVYDNLSKSLLHLTRELGLDADKLRTIRGRDPAVERFPEAEDELAFIRGVMEDARSQAKPFADMPVSDELEAKDFEAYCRYRHFGNVFSSCIVSLEYLGYHPDVQVQPDVLDTIFERARSAALQFNHAVMDAARLREPSEDTEYPAVDPIAIPDDDLIDVERAIRDFEGRADA